MITQGEKINLFLNAISENLEMRRNEIEEEIAGVQRAETERAEKEANERSEAYIKTESAAARSQANRTLSLLETQLRNKLAAARSDMTGQIFETVAERLNAFVETTEYAGFLKKSAEGIALFYAGQPFTVFVRPADMRYETVIKAAGGELCGILADDSIRLGGCKAKSENGRVFVDDTLDARLHSQRQDFYERSGLSVETL